MPISTSNEQAKAEVLEFCGLDMQKAIDERGGFAKNDTHHCMVIGSDGSDGRDLTFIIFENKSPMSPVWTSWTKKTELPMPINLFAHLCDPSEI